MQDMEQKVSCFKKLDCFSNWNRIFKKKVQDIAGKSIQVGWDVSCYMHTHTHTGDIIQSTTHVTIRVVTI